jgi:hypothetical protein
MKPKTRDSPSSTKVVAGSMPCRSKDFFVCIMFSSLLVAAIASVAYFYKNKTPVVVWVMAFL